MAETSRATLRDVLLSGYEDLKKRLTRRLGSSELAGEALLWGIDLHNRSAHVGISLRPAFRSRGLGADAVRVLCRYGFAIRGLHRLQLETLADNHAMIQLAKRAGFLQEGVLRGSEWVDGGFADAVIFGLLAADLPPVS